MRALLAVGVGSFIGGVLRYVVAKTIQTTLLTTFPFGTLTVNIIGCFTIGVLFGISSRGNLTQDWRLFLVTGLCGGFTTFSSFSQETFSLLRDGQYFYTGGYIAASVILGVFATIIGFSIIKLF